MDFSPFQSYGDVKSFSTLRSVVDRIETPGARAQFEDAMLAARDIVEKRNHWSMGPSSWSPENATDFCALAHIASCYDKKFGQHNDDGLTANLCDGIAATRKHPTFMDLRRKSAAAILLEKPDEFSLGRCINLMLAVAGIPKLDYVIERTEYRKFLEIVDNFGMHGWLPKAVADSYYALAFHAAGKEGKIPPGANPLQRHSVAVECEYPPASLLLVQSLRESEIANSLAEGKILYSVLRVPSYSSYPHAQAWMGAYNCILERFDPAAWENVHRDSRWSASEEGPALMKAFGDLFTAIKEYGGEAMFNLREERGRWLQFADLQGPHKPSFPWESPELAKNTL